MTTVDAQLLSAYVDGELDAADAARVARLIAEDGGVAREVAKLFELKQAVAALAPDAALLCVAAPRRRGAWRVAAAIAACLLAVILAGMPWLSRPVDVGGERSAMLAEAARHHDAWVRAAGAHTQPVAAVPGVFAPELGAAGLALATAERDVVIGGRPASHAGYVGSRGCRLSLFAMSPGDPVPDVLTLGEADRLLWASWETRSARFLLIARKMAETRFATIAGVLRSMTSRRERDESSLVAQLEGARQPCHA